MAENSPVLFKSKEFEHEVMPSNLSPIFGAFLLRLNDVGKFKKMKWGVRWGVRWGVKKRKKNVSK